MPKLRGNSVAQSKREKDDFFSLRPKDVNLCRRSSEGANRAVVNVDYLGVRFCQSDITGLTVNGQQPFRAVSPQFPVGLRCQSQVALGDTVDYWPDDPLVAEATARIKPRK